jgi:two-component system sensor histidine kinase KdpD
MILAGGAVALVTVAYARLVQVNPTTVALSYVVLILIIATRWGVAESMVASIAAAVCFNFFFLPPVGTLTIQDPQNWVAVVAFLLTAVVVSQLSGRSRQRRLEAEAGRRTLERLYELSRTLLLADGQAAIHMRLAQHIAQAFAVSAVALYEAGSDLESTGGAGALPAIEPLLREVVRTGQPMRREDGVTVVPISLGGPPIGSLAVAAPAPDDRVLQSISSLAAIGFERARSIDTAARGEAARQSGELRAAVLDALAHEFKTPLTSMKVAAADLASSAGIPVHDRELAAIIREEVDRLQALVSDAVQMLRIDAGQFIVHRERRPVRALVGPALRAFEAALDGHRVVTHLSEDLVAQVDADLIGLALRQLLDNALKYSPPDSCIEVRAGGGSGTVWIAVRNSGSTIATRDRPKIFDRFYRGANAKRTPGTGMGLAIVREIAAAHGGTLQVSSDEAIGTVFTLSLAADGGSR